MALPTSLVVVVGGGGCAVFCLPTRIDFLGLCYAAWAAIGLGLAWSLSA